MTYPWAVLVMRNLEDSQREIQFLSKYGAEYPLGLLLPSLDCRLHLKLFGTSALRVSVCISCPFGDLCMPEDWLPC